MLQEVVGGEFHLFVSPLRRPVDTRDQTGSMDPSKVSVHEGVERLRFIVGTLSEAEMPFAVLVP